MNFFKSTLLALLATVSLGALAQEPVIRKNLAARLPNLPAIDEVRKTWAFYRDRRPDAYDDLVQP